MSGSVVPTSTTTPLNKNTPTTNISAITLINNHSSSTSTQIEITDENRMQPPNINQDPSISTKLQYPTDIKSNKDQSKTTDNYIIISWNLWCMMFAPRTLSNPHRCSTYLLTIAQENNWQDFDGLIIAGFQELWAWKTGIFPSFIIKYIAYVEYIPYIGIFFSYLIQFITLLFGILPILKCLPFKYKPKSYFFSKLKNVLPFNYYNNKIPMRHFIDNGLLILSNCKTNVYGSHGYKHMQCDDSLAYKGFLYAYFEKYHTLVINTHLQSAGDGTVRLQQVEELSVFIDEFSDKLDAEYENNVRVDEEFGGGRRKLRVIALGDFNIDMTNHNKIIEYNHKKENNIQLLNKISIIEENEIIDGLQVEKLKLKLKIDLKSNEEKYNKMMDESDSHHHRSSTLIDRALSYCDIAHLLGNEFIKVNSCEPTLLDIQWGCLDHVFCNFKYERFSEKIMGRIGKLSDHLLIVIEFVADDDWNGSEEIGGKHHELESVDFELKVNVR